MSPLAEEFGAAEVWEASLHVLGHPPTWLIGQGSIQRLREYLQLKKQQQHQQQ